MFRGEDRKIEGTIQEDDSWLPIVRLVEKNRLHDDEQRNSFSREKIVDELQSGARFAIVNA